MKRTNARFAVLAVVPLVALLGCGPEVGPAPQSDPGLKTSQQAITCHWVYEYDDQGHVIGGHQECTEDPYPGDPCTTCETPPPPPCGICPTGTICNSDTYECEPKN
jgi:hypothetical protein